MARTTSRFAAVCSLSVFGFASAAEAAFVAPSDWSRPTSVAQAASTLSTFQHFDVFSDDDGSPGNGVLDTGPDVADFNPNGPATVASSLAFVTSSGNLYNPVSVIDLTLTVPSFNDGSAVATRFLLQVQTQGNPLLIVDSATGPDFSAFTVNGQSLATFAPKYRQLATVPGGPLGAIIDHAIDFTLPGNVASYVIAWETAGTSTSHRQILVDSNIVIPEPAAISVLALGSLALGRRR
jgi:hypothetical protein